MNCHRAAGSFGRVFKPRMASHPGAGIHDPNVVMPPTDLPRRTTDVASERLYSVLAVVLATFFGSPVAGGIVLSLNCQRLAQPGVIPQILLWTGLLTCASVTLGGLVPSDLRLIEALLVLVQVAIMYLLATRLQGRAIAAHIERGGEMASHWGAVGIGIVCGLILLWLLVGLGLTPAPGVVEEETVQALT